MPGHTPVAHTLFDCVDDLGRDTFVNVPLFGCGILGVRHRSCSIASVFRDRARRQPDAVPIRSSVRFLLRIEHQKRRNTKPKVGASTRANLRSLGYFFSVLLRASSSITGFVSNIWTRVKADV